MLGTVAIDRRVDVERVEQRVLALDHFQLVNADGESSRRAAGRCPRTSCQECGEEHSTVLVFISHSYQNKTIELLAELNHCVEVRNICSFVSRRPLNTLSITSKYLMPIGTSKSPPVCSPSIARMSNLTWMLHKIIQVPAEC